MIDTLEIVREALEKHLQGWFAPFLRKKKSFTTLDVANEINKWYNDHPWFKKYALDLTWWYEGTFDPGYMSCLCCEGGIKLPSGKIRQIHVKKVDWDSIMEFSNKVEAAGEELNKPTKAAK